MNSLKDHSFFATLSCTRSCADVMCIFDSNCLSLLQEADVDMIGTVAVDTTAKAYLTADFIVQAFEEQTIGRDAATNAALEFFCSRNIVQPIPNLSKVAHLLLLSARREKLSTGFHRT